MAGRIKYGTNVFEHTVIDNYNFGDGGKATNMSGFAGIGTTGYCVKRGAGVEKSALFKINGYTTTSPTPKVTSVTELPFATYGMTTDGTYLYIAATGQSVYKISTAGKTIAKYTHNIGTQALAHYNGSQFIFMANKDNSADKKKLCFVVGELSNGAIVEKARFYVTNTAFDSFNELTLQDIYYDSKYGLFIITNEKVNGAYNGNNLILRVELGNSINTLNGKTLEPVSEYKFVGKEAKYKQCNVESMVIGPDSRLYTVANIVPSASGGGHTKDGMFYVGNLRFYTDEPFWCKIYFNDGVDIPHTRGTADNGSYKCVNPGGFVLDKTNEKIGYCISTCSAGVNKNNATVLLQTNNIDSQKFVCKNKENEVIRGLGHANGLAYYNRALYVAAYIKSKIEEEVQKHIVKLSTDGDVQKTYKSDDMIGGISHYKGSQFIGVNYLEYVVNGIEYKYAQRPKFFIGTFNDSTNKFVVAKTFTTDNPGYVNKGVLQDIHYDPAYGLLFISKIGEESTIYRIPAETIENAADGAHVDVVEQWLCNNNGKIKYEPESPCIGNGKLYISSNAKEDKMDKARLVQTLDFC